MACGWEGEKVRLVPLDTERHLANALEWLNDPEVTEWTLIGDFPIARLGEAEFFQRAERADPSAGATELTLAVETLEGEHVGFTGLHRIDWRHGCAHTGLLIGRKEMWGRGLATDALRVRTRYAFEVLGLRLLLSEALLGNERSIRALTSAGYERAGLLPGRYWKRGAFRDAILFYRSADPSEK
jgi:RimJ/RimL family protein N-acetyltransferase